MRRLTTSTALVFLSLATPLVCTDAARGVPQQCPVIKISCTDTSLCGNALPFNAEVSAIAAGAKLSYNWVVSAGMITSGQGTPSIKVDTTGLAWVPVEATVMVAGLPETCAGKATCTTAIICEHLDRKLDEYGNISWSDEKVRLDNFVVEMQNEPTARGYLICYGGKVGHAGEAQRRCRRAKNYVGGRRGINAARIVTADGGYREDLTVELWVLPAGATLPTASPTVDPREVRFIKGKLKGGARHR